MGGCGHPRFPRCSRFPRFRLPRIFRAGISPALIASGCKRVAGARSAKG